MSPQCLEFEWHLIVRCLPFLAAPTRLCQHCSTPVLTVPSGVCYTALLQSLALLGLLPGAGSPESRIGPGPAARAPCCPNHLCSGFPPPLTSPLSNHSIYAA